MLPGADPLDNPLFQRNRPHREVLAPLIGIGLAHRVNSKQRASVWKCTADFVPRGVREIDFSKGYLQRIEGTADAAAPIRGLQTAPTNH